jgi:hypothetical protein
VIPKTKHAKPLKVYAKSVTYRGGPYVTPCRTDAEGNVWYDLAEIVKDMNAQWRMRFHFDSLSS